MNTAERQARNDQIIALRVRGVPTAQVARTMDVHRDTVNEVMREFRASGPKLRENDPLAIVDEMIEGYQADLAELAIIANSTTNDAVRVGAINSRMSARDRMIALLQATGVLPHDLGKLQIEVDVRYTAQRMVAVLRQHDVPLEVQEELLNVLTSAAGDKPVIEAQATAA